MTRRFFGNLLGVHRPTSGIFTLGELGPTTTGALTRPQLRWGGMLGRSAILGGGTGGPLSISLNPVSSSGTNSGTSSGTVAIVKGAGNVTSGQERWNTSSLANTGSFTLANEAEVTFEVWGAAGGSETNIYPALGGGGEYRKATFTLAPGTYYYLCGAGGGCGDTTAYRVGTGGFGGGGVGSTNNSSITGTSATAFGNGGYNGAANYSSANSGGGGGLTGIFTSATPSQSSALIVAGGGGGAGYNGAAGLPGGDTSSRSGTASSGGIAPANAEDGAAGKGGASNTFGGGGGGGYWGGAGGGSSTNSPGGGGGRGYTDGAGFNTTTTAGSGNTPGGKSSANYVSGYGASNGSVWTSGGGGLIAISAVEVSARFTTTGLIKLSELQQIRLGPSSASTVFPVFSSGSTASFPEGGTGTVYTAVAADSDNNAITFGLGSSKDEALFSISASGQVTFLATPDFESPADGNADNVYDIDIIATNGVNATTQTVAITVSDQNDPPVITSASTASFQENGTGAAYTITATDPNGDGITFTLGNSNDEALFNIVNNLVTFNTSPDFENPSDANADNAYIIEVIATDSAGNSASQLVTINVTDDPTDVTAPVISGASSISAQENATTASTILETFTATGGGTLSWSLTGTDAADFSINSSGELTFSSPPDFESPADANTDNSYNVTINVSNEAGSDTLAVTVAVTDDTADNPIAPQISGPSTATFQENGTGAVATYTIQAGTAPITFSLSGTDAARFSISSSGVVTFNSPPDFESPTDSGGNNVYDLTVTASNAGGSTSTSLTVTVTNDTSDDPFYFTIPYPTNATSRVPEYYTMYADNSYVYWIGDDSQTSNGGHEYQLVRVGKSGSGMNFYNALASSTDTVDWSFWSGSYFYAKENLDAAINYDLLRRFSKTGGSQSSVQMSDNGSYVENYSDAVVNDNGNYYAYRAGAQVWGKFRVSDGLVTQTYSVSYSHTSLSGAVVINVSGTNYIYALDRSSARIRRYNAPSGSGTAFSSVGSNSISWPTSNTSTYRGIAYDGSHVWICRGDEIAKFAVPSSAAGTFLPSP